MRWGSGDLKREWEKEYEDMIFICKSKDGKSYLEKWKVVKMDRYEVMCNNAYVKVHAGIIEEEVIN